MKIFAPSFCLHVIIACVLLPLLLKNLRGHSKGLLIFQQVAIVFYLLFTFVESLIDLGLSFDSGNSQPVEILQNLSHFDESNTTETDQWPFLNLSKFVNSLGNGFSYVTHEVESKPIPAKLSYFWDTLRNMFYYQHNMLMILQSLHYRALICDSLNFEEYRRHVFKRLVLVLTCSFIFSSPHSLFLVMEFSQIGSNTSPFTFVKRSFKQILYVYDMTGMAITKAATAVILIFVAYSVKKALNQSNEVRDWPTRGCLSPPLFIVVCLVPLGIHFFHLLGDVPRFILYLVHYLVWNGKLNGCLDHNSYFSVNIFLPLNFFAYCIGSLVQCSAYLIYFPNLRKVKCF